MMQVLISEIIYQRLDFIEEGSLFPQIQTVDHCQRRCIDILYKNKGQGHLFRLPSNIRSRIENIPQIYVTLDNDNLIGVDTQIISDSDIKNSYGMMVKSKPDDAITIKFMNALIHVGSKDEADPNILMASIKHSLRIAIQLKREILYLPHPSMHFVGLDRYSQIFRKYNVEITEYNPIEYLLYESPAKLHLCGDATSVMITVRLGHKFYSK